MIGNLISAGMSLLGGLKGQKSQEKMAEQNIALQKQFAQEGIQWKVADAKAAGVHPLYALGAQTHSFAPVSVGDSLSPALANAGQDIGRAINATSNASQRIDAVTRAAQGLALEKAGLENELLRSQIRRNNSAGNPPPSAAGAQWLIPGQGSTQLPGTVVEDGPLTRTGVDQAAPYREGGALPEVGWLRTPGGGYAPVPSKDAKERIEDIMPAEWMWAIRNYVKPNLGMESGTPGAPLPPGYDAWVWHPLYQEYRPMRRPKWMGRFGKYFHY